MRTLVCLLVYLLVCFDAPEYDLNYRGGGFFFFYFFPNMGKMRSWLIGSKGGISFS